MARRFSTAVALICAAAGIVMSLYVWRATTALTAREIQRDVVRGFLNDGASAVFRADVVSRHFGADHWCGEVNAKNRFGAYVGFTRYMAYVAADRALAKQDFVQIAPVGPPMLDGDRADWARFEEVWAAACQ